MLTSCSVGPDFKRPDAPKTDSYLNDTSTSKPTTATNAIAGAAQTFENDKDVPADWWKLFNSPTLNALVDEAIKHNPDLTAAQASLRQAQENVYAQEGYFFPTIDANPQVTREKISPASFGEPGFPSSIFTLYNASVSVSYGIDIFGLTRRNVESAEAQADYQRFEMRATYLTLTTNVVTAAIAEASLRAQIKETQDIIAAYEHQLKILNTQFELGAIAKTSVLEQQTTVEQIKATLPGLTKQLSQKHDALAVLLGKLPSDNFDENFMLDNLSLPEKLPLSLPSKLVEQRPDIKAAEATLHQASAQIGVATANMLPQVTLTGSYGNEATNFSGLSAASANVWSIAGGLTQPIFHGGTLFHERREAYAAYDSAFAKYKSTVLNAFANVADTLRALQFDADALKAQDSAANAASGSLKLAHDQFKDGGISYPQLLDAERSYSQVRVNLVQAQAARLADTAALFQALGGGWQAANDTDRSPVPTQSLTNEKKSWF